MGIDKDLKREVRVETGMKFGRITPSPTEVKESARQVLESKLKQKRLQLDAVAKESLVSAICDDLLGFGPLEPLLRDNTITEIMVNGPDRIFIERSGRKTLSENQFDDESHLRTIMEKMLVMAGRRLDESSPYVDFSLKDGSRINAIISPLAVDGSTVTIRKFLDSLKSLDDLVRLKTINEPMGRFLRAAVQAKLNIMFSGATGAGKTATLNVLSHEIAPEERVITIEDALELKLNQRHVVRLLTRANNIEGKGAVPIRELVKNCLRMRPDRIIVGECRGGEALDMLQAMNTGHDGSMSTGHANSPRDMLSRLETMVLMAGVDLPLRAIREQVSSAVDLIVHQSRLKDGTRRITNITEVQGMEGDVIVMQDVFVFEQTGIAEGKIQGRLRPTGIRPKFVEKFEVMGIHLPRGLFGFA